MSARRACQATPFRICEARDVLHRLPCSRLGESYGLVNFGGNLSLDACQFLGVDHVVGLEPATESRDRPLLPPRLHFGFVTVELGIEHGMSTEPVGPAFEKIRLTGFAYGMDRAPRRSFDRDHIHPIDGF